MINGSLTIEKLVEFQSQVQKCFPTSDVIIAGGCLRDLLHNKQVSDIDIFVGRDGIEDDWLQDDCFAAYEGGRKALAALLRSTSKEKFDSNGKPCYAHNSIFRVVDFPEGFRMYPVQLIFHDDDPREVIKASFDFGLCQVWLDRGKLQMSSDYWRDHERQSFHYRPQSKEQGRVTTRERIEKLQAKYPGWKFRGVEKMMRAPTLQVSVAKAPRSL